MKLAVKTLICLKESLFVTSIMESDIQIRYFIILGISKEGWGLEWKNKKHLIGAGGGGSRL